ncbi:hypothetical protein Q4543_22310, partial [Salipiger sp. 1_MG-2023]|uniref:hypothetical protein n=1 Tax=Salipiger sp. 1_MG-2023 TaxID=3062665 RepID=UPI0026E24858
TPGRALRYAGGSARGLLHQALGHYPSLALRRGALVCFEATSGQEWRLRASLGALRIVARELPPVVVPGPRRIDAELIARIMVLRPEAGRSHPAGKLRAIRALTSK